MKLLLSNEQIRVFEMFFLKSIIIFDLSVFINDDNDTITGHQRVHSQRPSITSNATEIRVERL